MSDDRPIHTIPVPEGWTAEQAMEVINRDGRLPDLPIRGWANVPPPTPEELD